MHNLLKIGISCFLIFLLTGCSTIIIENETSREVKGIGVDVTFYPVFSIRAGVYHYVIQIDKK